MIKSEILVPLLNANEPEARLVSIHAKDGQSVEKGALLFTIETTKAAAEVESPEAGFLRLVAKEGDTLAVGDRLAYLTETADEPLPQASNPSSSLITHHSSLLAPSSLRITTPARLLAKNLGIDLATLPTDRLVTESVIRELTGGAKASMPMLDGVDPQKSILVYGGGGHAKTILSMIQALGSYQIAGVVDDGIAAGERVLGIPVLGGGDVISALAAQGLRLAANGVGGILDHRIRFKIFELLESAGFSFPALVHPRATVEPSARVGEGTQVFAHAYVGSETVLHPRCMVNTGAVVSHECVIGSYSHIAPGALLAGLVHVGERTLVGMGATTAIGVHIGSGVRIGNEAAILADVPDRTIIQAGKIWSGELS
jgi:sugar O-acyltransferase (sialic acid O-acetyltransferase NeuD family)